MAGAHVFVAVVLWAVVNNLLTYGTFGVPEHVQRTWSTAPAPTPAATVELPAVCRNTTPGAEREACLDWAVSDAGARADEYAEDAAGDEYLRESCWEWSDIGYSSEDECLDQFLNDQQHAVE